MTAPTLARPALVTPELLARQFTRLADWSVQTRDERALTAGHRLAGGGRHAARFDSLCDVTERMTEIETGFYEFGPSEDPDDVDRDAEDARRDLLTALVAAAAAAGLGRTCSVCFRTYYGTRCRSCGWW